MEHRPELALLIQGHHGGLRSPADFKSWLASTAGPGPELAAAEARRVIHDLAPPAALAISQGLNEDILGQEMFLRLLFSALVDADYLDTERHFDEHRATKRPHPVPMEELWRRFKGARGEPRPGMNAGISAIREQVYVACNDAASQPPGLFRLSVPTGGGKTLSGMAFALRHALAHGFQRVVVAVPFITMYPVLMTGED